MRLYVEGIEIELIRKNIKNMHLYVMRPDGRIRLTAPMRLSEKRIIDFVLSRVEWIRDQQAKILSEPHAAPITYSSGDILIIFGKPYTLEVIEGKRASFSLLDGKAELCCKSNSTPEQREGIVERAMRELLYARLAPLFEKWERISALEASSYQIKKMKTRWGTCNTRTKKVWINLELYKKSDECIEYVIMHELAHLRVPNHGKDFVAIMDIYMPRWRELREELNKKSAP